MRKILITGGVGFIGSHTCISLLEKGYNLIVIDSNINSYQEALSRIKLIAESKGINKIELTFEKGDIRDKKFLENIFSSESNLDEPIDGVIHFAGLKSLSESIQNPILYWENNVMGSLNLFKTMEKFNCRTLVFSSSASIYGISTGKPILENNMIKPTTPYGQTKVAIENILNDIFQSSNNRWSIANLRYFNPIGAHESGLIGEYPLCTPNNLFPRLCSVAKGISKSLKIYGNDWETPDGTCIRDYIHVMDLAEAHISALDYLSNNKPQIINMNIGTGKGTSVLELINKFNEINDCKVSYEFCKRRKGDIAIVIANNKKAISTLCWKPKRNIGQMCKDGWKWQLSTNLKKNSMF